MEIKSLRERGNEMSYISPTIVPLAPEAAVLPALLPILKAAAKLVLEAAVSAVVGALVNKVIGV